MNGTLGTGMLVTIRSNSNETPWPAIGAATRCTRAVEGMELDVVLGAESRIIDPHRRGEQELGWLHPLA